LLALPVNLDTDVVGRVAVVEGYNTNTYQAQDDARSPIIRRHPSPFTGADGGLELRFLGRDADRVTINLGVRANHYEPIEREVQSDDGAFNGAIVSRVTLGPRTVLTTSDTGTVTSFNAAHVTDGTIFAFDPTQQRSAYWLNDVSSSIAHDLAPGWRLTQSLGASFSGTLHSPPTLLRSGQRVEHRGLDYVLPYVETDLNRDFTRRSSADVMLRYQYSLQLFVLDLTRNPPRNIGPDKQAFVTGLGGWTYHVTQDVATVLRAGGVLASAPPRDPDQRPILSPSGMAELYYTRSLFDLVASGAYTYGSINPRLGSGPTGSASVLAVGIPHPVGDWRNLAAVARAQVSYSSLLTGVSAASSLGLYAFGAELRYGVSPWLGVIVGYDFRYATFSTPGLYSPPFVQQVVFVGLSGYFSSDRSVLPLTTFTAPVQPPS
jgi:hypothetical protein